jgi:membrane protease YdiL (CAAX protease family)
LWLLYTFPRRLSSVLAEKAALWSGLALLYTAVGLVAAAFLKPALAADLLLAVGAAPIFEEFIFRGLIHRGLRRGLPLLAAAMFALVHPPQSAAPVFFLGLTTAVAFERTGLLLVPAITHAVYNASVFLLARYCLS